MRRAWFRSAIVPVAFLGAACHAPPSVAEQGAVLIVGTVGVGSVAQDAFAVSPSGEQILFARENRSGVDAETVAVEQQPLLGFAILDRRSGRVQAVGIEVEGLRSAVESDPGLVLGSLCWMENEQTVYLGTSVGPSISVRIGDAMPEWRLGTQGVGSDPVACPASTRWWQEPGGGISPFVVDDRGGAVRVTRRRDGRVLFEYGGVLAAPDAYIHDALLAPDGNRIAIVVSRGLGSFTGPSELFVVSVAGSDPAHMALGGPVYNVRWSSTGELFAVSNLERSRERAIFVWAIQSR
jgi:hypothetical protein